MLPAITLPSAAESLTCSPSVAPAVTVVSHCWAACFTGACTSMRAAEAGSVVVVAAALFGNSARILPTCAPPTTTS